MAQMSPAGASREICEVDSCNAAPKFALLGEKPRRCRDHAAPGMIHALSSTNASTAPPPASQPVKSFQNYENHHGLRLTGGAGRAVASNYKAGAPRPLKGQPGVQAQPIQAAVVDQPFVVVAQQQGWRSDRPESYMVCSILTFLLCCWPLGLVALICSCNVHYAYSSGRYKDAIESSQNARKLNIASFAIGIVLWIIIMAASA